MWGFGMLKGGCDACLQEMNPVSPGFQRVFANPFAYAAFKSTEPWLLEYVSLDLHALCGMQDLLRSCRLTVPQGI